MNPTPELLSPGQVADHLTSLEGWVALDGALHADLLAPDFPAAVGLVAAIADDAEAADHHPDLDLRWRRVRLSLSTHSAGGITAKDTELAAQISARAAAAGATVTPAYPVTISVGIDCTDADAVMPFWAAILGYQPQPLDADGEVYLRDPRGSGPSVWFQHMDPPRHERSRIHLDVYVPAAEMATRRDAAVAAGGRVLDTSHDPSWWVLADPEGNEACICRG
jgi:4a-hydroxytetrahydrobiopterin dehydratase